MKKIMSLGAVGALLVGTALLAGCDVNVDPGSHGGCRRVVYKTVCHGGHWRHRCYTVKRVRWVC